MEKQTILEGKKWHSFTGAETLEHLETRAEFGLSDAEVSERQKLFGKNVLTPKKGTPAWLRFLMQFNQPLVYILFHRAFQKGGSILMNGCHLFESVQVFFFLLRTLL